MRLPNALMGNQCGFDVTLASFGGIFEAEHDNPALQRNHIFEIPIYFSYFYTERIPNHVWSIFLISSDPLFHPTSTDQPSISTPRLFLSPASS